MDIVEYEKIMPKIQFNRQYLLIAILAISFILRVYRLGTPSGYVFDEVYHAFTAKAYANNDPRGYEWWNPSPEKGSAYEWLHPPVSKLLMAGSIKLLGENSFAWRLPSAIFGVLVIYLTYLLTKTILTLPKPHPHAENTALLAAFFVALDGLLLVQSRIAMNDIFVVTFMVASLIYYWRFRHQPKNKTNLALSSLFVGLSIATKWSGLFLLGIIGLIELSDITATNIKPWLKKLPKLFLAYAILPIIIYLLSYTQFFLQGHTISQFIELHNQIIRYETGLEATHPYQSKAWTWPLLIRPVWYYVDYSKPNFIGNIYALCNPLLAWGGLLAVVYCVFLAFRARARAGQYLFPVLAYFFVWTPWLFSPRIMFFYHYTPAMPFLAIITGLAISKLWYQSALGKRLGLIYTVVTAATFIAFFPLWTGLVISQSFLKHLFWLSTWK